MPSKRTRRSRTAAPAVTPELRRKIERLIELNEAHMKAIRGGSQAFYTDGRHEEMGGLMTEVHRALGIRPWHNADEMLQAALAASAS